MGYSPNSPAGYRITGNTIEAITAPEYNGGSRDTRLGYRASPPSIQDFLTRLPNYPYSTKEAAQKELDRRAEAVRAELAAKQAEEKRRTDLATQIRDIATRDIGKATPQFKQSLEGLSAQRNFGASDLATKLNFQVSDEQIINDYNTAKQSKLSNIIQGGNTQIAGIRQLLESTKQMVGGLPSGSQQRTEADSYINLLNNDLASVTSAVTEAQEMQKNFKPITMDSPEGLKEITSFRSFLQLPEERASQQLYQIDPDSYRTAVSLGRQYRDMATQPLEPTTTPETEQLRKTIEEEAMNQLRLGSTIGAEERRGYEQAIRGAQTARGNIFGLGPAVQEAAQIGAAGEQRKLARFGAAQQFLGSGETSGAARARDLLLREGIQQNRLGAAAGFIAGGPSIGNLAQARTAQQQGALQSYIQANQALPGGFNQQASTASNFYQTVDPGIPVALTGEFNKLYNTQSNYLANTYGAQVDALSRVAVANSFPNYLSAGADIFKGVGSLGGTAGIFACWVAREVYGADNPKWLEFREWMFTKASDNLRKFYLEYGERIAKSIRNKPKIKAIIRKWMDSKIG